MIYDIEISDQAKIDLRGIFEYIAFELQAPENASGQLDRLEACIDRDTLDSTSNHRTICKCFQGRCTGILGFWNERTHFKAIQYRCSDHCNKTKYKEIED